MCNYCDMWPSMGEWWYCGMLDKFLLGNVLCLRKRKKYLFSFLFDVSKYKKSQDSYTNNLKWDHAKQFEVYTTITSPFSFAALYNCRINTKELKDASGWKISWCLQKTTKKTPQHHAEQLLLGVCKSIYKLVILLRRQGGTWDCNFICPTLSNYPTESTNEGPNTNLWRAERVDTFCYL